MHNTNRIDGNDRSISRLDARDFRREEENAYLRNRIERLEGKFEGWIEAQDKLGQLQLEVRTTSQTWSFVTRGRLGLEMHGKVAHDSAPSPFSYSSIMHS
jgi:hypothetical protein